MRLGDLDALMEIAEQQGHLTIDDILNAPTIDAVPVCRCKDCVLHGNCLTEDTFNLCRIENPFCCGGKRKDGDKE